MPIKLNAFMWRTVLVAMTILFWINVVAAQDEVEAAEEATNNAPVFIILFTGLAAVAALGFLMNSRNSGTGSNSL
jgi:uncharacterized membrane protein YadS